METCRPRFCAYVKKLIVGPALPPAPGVLQCARPENPLAVQLSHMDFYGKVAAPVHYANKRGPDPNVVSVFERDLPEIIADFGSNPLEDWALAACSMDSVYLNVAKYQRSQPSNYDPNAWRKAVDTTLSYLQMACHNPREITFEEALQVFPKPTSAGVTMSKWGHSKKEVLENPEAVEHMRLFDINPTYRTLQRGVPKEEIRPMGKVLQNLNRSILVVGMDHMVTGFRLWWDMNRMIVDYWYQEQFPIKFGFTPFYGGWHLLTMPLIGRPSNSYDVSLRDSSLSRLHFEAILKVRLSLMVNHDAKFKSRACGSYGDSTFGLITMPDGYIFEKDTGNSTGGHNTISDNSIGSLLEVCYVFHKLFPAWSSAELRKNLLLQIVGDDVRISPTKEIASLVTPGQIKLILEKDLLVTINWEFDEWRSVMDYPWLSMKTAVYGPNWLVPVPAEPTKLLASYYYGRENYKPLDTLRRLVNFRMLSFTDPRLFKYFDRWTWELVKQHNNFYSSEKEWVDIVASIMPTTSLEHLYLGWESGSAPVSPTLYYDDCMDQDFGPWLSSLRPTVVPLVERKPDNFTKVDQSYSGKRENVVEKPHPILLVLALVVWLLYIYLAFNFPIGVDSALVSFANRADPELALPSREPDAISRWGNGGSCLYRVNWRSWEVQPGVHTCYLEMTKPTKTKKPKTPEQKAKRKAARKRREQRHKAAVTELKGKGDYSSRRRVAPFSGSLKGRGDFFGDLWDTAKNIAGKGIKAAGWVADNATWLAPLVGMGDYQVGPTPRHNSIFRGSMVPVIKNSFIPTIVRHREYLGEIKSYSGTGGTSIQVQSFNVNPGLAGSAPWLAGIASQFQEYFLLGGAFEVTSEQTAISTDSVGTVVVAPRYDVTLPAPVSSVQILNTEGKVDGRPIDNLLMAIECDPATRPTAVLQVRTGALPASAALQLFDHCVVDVMNWGQADSTKTIGHMWLILEVGLLMPVDLDATNGDVLSDHWQLTTVTSANNLGTTAADISTASLGGTVTPGSTAKYTFPAYVNAGAYLVALNYGHSSSATVTAPTITCTNCTKLQMWATSAGFDVATAGTAPPAGTSTGTQTAVFVVTVNDTIASFTVTGLTFAGTCYGDLVVTPYNGNMLTLTRSKHRWASHWAALDREEKVRNRVTEEISERTTRRIIEELLGLRVVELSDDEKEFDKVSPRSVREKVVSKLYESGLDISALKNLPSVQAAAPKGAPRHG